ncbi:MAG: MBL fold metallo-hydrolase [Deltaproteobacteria bacterium]|nr:MBL fold metallo-hydrolase [Deltaproteobacteria bacterium]
MNIEQIKVGFMEVFCYLVSCPRTREALFIDPAGNESELVNHMQEQGLTLMYIVNTHGHADHTCGNKKVKALTGAKIVMHEVDDQVFNSPEGEAMARQWGFTPSPRADITVNDGDRIVIGDISLEVIHTPGHSPGGICLHYDAHVFTGDTLFVGAIGRTDLPGSSYDQFMRSIRERLLVLPPETVVWPGHDYGSRPASTIGHEKAENPWLTE